MNTKEEREQKQLNEGLAKMRQEILSRIESYYLSYDHLNKNGYFTLGDKEQELFQYNWDTFKEKANVSQLWRILTNVVERKTVFHIVDCTDHVGITFSGMYCGIELDGYMHS